MQGHEAVNGTAWVNSDIAGAVTEETTFRLQDDFHAAVNHDWLVTAEMHPGEPSMSAFRERTDEVQEQVEALLQESVAPSDPELAHIADLVHTFYYLFLDMSARDKLGVEPVMPLIDKIRGIKTLDDLTAYLVTDATAESTVFADTEAFADKKNSLMNVVYLGCDSFSLVDANEYRNLTPQGERTRDANRAFFAAMLQKVGYAEADAQKVVADMEALERQIAIVCLGADARGRDDIEEITYNARTRAELEAACPRYPLVQILDAQGLGASDKFVLTEPDWLERLDQLYTAENIDGFKALILFRTFARFGSMLDQACYDLAEEWKNARLGSSGSTPLARKAFDMTRSYLGMAVGRLYVDRYLTDETKADVEELIGKVIDVYRRRLGAAEWLSEETRRRAVEKLDAMTVRVGRPTVWPHYEELEFGAAPTLVSAVCAIRTFEQARDAAKVNQEVDREEWLMAPQAVNAYYLPTDNSINILAGILGGVFYDPAGSVESRMGGIGMVIGHEITHAFDKHGSLYDKDGNLGESWWTDADRAAFDERTEKVAEYWDGIEVLPGMNTDGHLTCGENIADLGGICSMVEIGRGIPGFDWREFFMSYARDWRLKEAPQLAEYLLVNDVHAPGHLRTNAAVQQVAEFYEAFDVKPGDGMYLASEDRLEVW